MHYRDRVKFIRLKVALLLVLAGGCASGGTPSGEATRITTGGCTEERLASLGATKGAEIHEAASLPLSYVGFSCSGDWAMVSWQNADTPDAEGRWLIDLATGKITEFGGPTYVPIGALTCAGVPDVDASKLGQSFDSTGGLECTESAAAASMAGAGPDQPTAADQTAGSPSGTDGVQSRLVGCLAAPMLVVGFGTVGLVMSTDANGSSQAVDELHALEEASASLEPAYPNDVAAILDEADRRFQEMTSSPKSNDAWSVFNDEMSTLTAPILDWIKGPCSPVFSGACPGLAASEPDRTVTGYTDFLRSFASAAASDPGCVSALQSS